MPAPTKQPKLATQIRQASLVQAALVLASQRNPSDITTGDLAQAVGLTQGAVFRHFASKEAIWLAVLDWATETLMAQLHAAADGAAVDDSEARNPLAALQAIFLAHVNFVIAHPGIPRVVFQELQHEKVTPLKASVRELMQRYRVLITTQLESARTQGLLVPGVDLHAAAVLFIGSVQGLVMQSLLSGQPNAMATQAPSVFAIYLRGLIERKAP